MTAPADMSPVELAEALAEASASVRALPPEASDPFMGFCDLLDASSAALRDLYGLGLMVEECGALAQVVGKWLRFGPDRAGPDGPRYQAMSARQLLPIEAGDAKAAIDWAGLDGILGAQGTERRRSQKLDKLLSPDSRDDQGLRLAPIPRELGR